MAVIRDINEYRLCAKNFNSPIVDRLFAVLWALSNLLLVKPANLQEICSEDPLVCFEKYVHTKKLNKINSFLFFRYY